MAEESKIPYIKRAWIEVEKKTNGKYRVKDFYAADPLELPNSYWGKFPRFYMIHDFQFLTEHLIVDISCDIHFVIRKGDNISPEKLNLIVKAMKEAGKRLTKIMKMKRKKIIKKMIGKTIKDNKTPIVRIEI